jgi:hypothetical protein
MSSRRLGESWDAATGDGITKPRGAQPLSYPLLLVVPREKRRHDQRPDAADAHDGAEPPEFPGGDHAATPRIHSTSPGLNAVV